MRVEKFLKQYPILIALIAFCISVVIWICLRNTGAGAFVVATFSTIFVALKYKLDQANYHAKLFEERYKIFNAIDDIQSQVIAGQKFDGETINILNDALKRSYYLFGNSTYLFIKKFRQEIINLVHLEGQSSGPEEIEVVKNSKKFLLELSKVDSDENLLNKFQELKIDSY